MSPASGELTAFSCCYGYLQQVAEWGRFRHQQRIREAEFRQGLDSAESHSAAETDKGGDAQEGRWESHTDANTNHLFHSSFADKVMCVSNAKNLYPFSPAWKHFSSFMFLMHTVYTKRNTLPLQVFFFFYSRRGGNSAVSRDGPDEYEWVRHSADMIQYVRLVDAVTDWKKHTHAHIH